MLALGKGSACRGQRRCWVRGDRREDVEREGGGEEADQGCKWRGFNFSIVVYLNGYVGGICNP